MSKVSIVKEDGSIEEGELLTETQLRIYIVLQASLHKHVCCNAYHSTYPRTISPCERYAQFLTTKILPTDPDLPEIIKAFGRPPAEGGDGESVSG